MSAIAFSPEPSPVTFVHEQIAQLAYALWEQRGCPEGSAEQDWLEAEARLSADDQ